MSRGPTLQWYQGNSLIKKVLKVKTLTNNRRPLEDKEVHTSHQIIIIIIK